MTLPPWYRVVEVVGGPLVTGAGPLRLLLGLALLVHVFDTANAIVVPVCGPGMTHHLWGFTWPCYPWGFQGPFADFWFWRSKTAYLTCNALQISLSAAGLLASFHCRPRWLGIVLATLAWIALIVLPYSDAIST